LPPELYQQIDRQVLFNLQPELRGSVSNGEFKSETNIEIITSLKPDFLPVLYPHLNNAPASLHQLSQSEPNNLRFNTETWLALQVKQPRLPVETGYCSFWDYLNLSVINNDISDSANFNSAIINFSQDWTESHLQSITDETIAKSLDKITKGLLLWIDSSIFAKT
jgi:hypothetical protein